jgi:hypothetical protein
MDPNKQQIKNIYTSIINGQSDKKQTISNLQSVLYTMAQNPSIYTQEIQGVKTTLSAYQGMLINHGTALKTLKGISS